MIMGILGIVLTALLLAGCTEPSSHAVEVEREREQLELRHDAFLAALTARDLDSTTAHFADDAVLHIANMPPVHGRSAIGQFYGNIFRFMAASEPTPETVSISSGADMAWTTGRVANTFESEEGPVHYAGKYLLVWEKREGDWAIVVYSISNNASEPRR